MKKIEIFDPAMCCPTGLCGTNINPELMRIAVVSESLKKQGIWSKCCENHFYTSHIQQKE